jgi:hypothetical protein
MMSILDYFRREGSWREKATALAAQLADIEAERERLEQAAAAALIAGDEDKGRADRDRQLTELAARERDLRRAVGEAEARAAADEAAAEAERRRQEEEAARQRRAEAEAAYLAQAEEVERAVKALAVSFRELAARGETIAEIDGGAQAGRIFNIAEIADRFAATTWKHLALIGRPESPRAIFPFDPGSFQGARREFREGEAYLVEALRGADSPATPAPSARSPRPLLGDEPEAA